MKRKTKLVTSIAAATALAAGAAGFSTYAWLATTRTVSGDIYSIKVDTTLSDLEIEFHPDLSNDNVSEQYVLPDPKQKRNKSQVTSTLNLGDASSGNGLDVYKPSWRPGKTDDMAESIKTIKGTDTKSNIAYYGYTLKASSAALKPGEAGESQGTGLDVYLNGLTIDPKKGPEVNEERCKNLAKNLRVAIMTMDSESVTSDTKYHQVAPANVEKSFVYQTREESAVDVNRYIITEGEGGTTKSDYKGKDGHYVEWGSKKPGWGDSDGTNSHESDNPDDRGAYGVEGYLLGNYGKPEAGLTYCVQTINTIKTFWTNTAIGGQDPKGTLAERKEQSQYICTINGSSSRYIMIGIWMEGTLQVDQTDATKGIVDIHFDLTSYDTVE